MMEEDELGSDHNGTISAMQGEYKECEWIGGGQGWLAEWSWWGR